MKFLISILDIYNIMFRSFKSKDLPDEFPHRFRRYSQYGQKAGRVGPPTSYYSEVTFIA